MTDASTNKAKQIPFGNTRWIKGVRKEMCTACTDNLHEPQQVMLLITFYKRFENFRL